MDLSSVDHHKRRTRGVGDQKSRNFADVLYDWSLEVLEVEEQDAGPVQDGLPGEVLSLQQHLQLPLALGEVIPRQVDEAGALLEHTEIHGVFEGVSGFELELPKNQFDWS